MYGPGYRRIEVKRHLQCMYIILAEKFLAFKTPLGPRYDGEIPEANRFNLPMLFAYLRNLKVRTLLMVILTFLNHCFSCKIEQNNCLNIYYTIDNKTKHISIAKYLKMACLCFESSFITCKHARPCSKESNPIVVL